MIRRVTCISALVVALVAMSVPAASAATVSPDKWAPKFCNAISDWRQSIDDQGTAVSTELQDPSDLKEARTKIADFLDDMVTATDQAADAIKQAGSPSIKNGDKVSAVFVKGFHAISKSFAKAQAKAEKLPISSAAAFKKSASKLGKAISNSGGELSQNFASVKKLDKRDQLDTAVQNAPECAFLNS